MAKIYHFWMGVPYGTLQDNLRYHIGGKCPEIMPS